MSYAVAVTTGGVGRKGLRDADFIQAGGWTSLLGKSLTTHLPALSQAHSEATEENSCSYSVSPSACVPNGRIDVSDHDCQHSVTNIGSPKKASPRSGMSLASLPHQEIDVVLWQGRGVDFGTKRFYRECASEALRSCKSTKRGGENE